MFIIRLLAGALVKRGFQSGWASILAWLITSGAAALILAGGWAIIKGRIISAHDTEVRMKQTELQLKRTNDADRVDTGLERRDQAAADRLRGASDDAVQKDQAHGNSPAGPVSNAVADELRRQRQGQQRSEPPGN